MRGEVGAVLVMVALFAGFVVLCVVHARANDRMMQRWLEAERSTINE